LNPRQQSSLKPFANKPTRKHFKEQKSCQRSIRLPANRRYSDVDLPLQRTTPRTFSQKQSIEILLGSGINAFLGAYLQSGKCFIGMSLTNGLCQIEMGRN
jgi:hypothetical protein